MIDFSNREVTTVFHISKEEPVEWYEIRYCPTSDWQKKGKDMPGLFAYLVLDWGDDFKLDGKDWNCTEKNKKQFYFKVPDTATKIMTAAGNPWTFSTDHVEVKKRLGKLQNTKEPGKKPNHSTTQPTAVDA